MEKELKIAELAELWGVSVPTTWNRIKKEKLKTFIKKNESNKDINYVSISDEIINSYVINVNNNVNKSNNNGYYEETLSYNNINKADNNVVDAEYSMIKPNPVQEFITVFKDYNNDLKNIQTDYNNRLERYNDELIKAYEELSTVKSKQLLLEDKANREGMYINEINQLKKENNRSQLFIKLLITVIVGLLLVIIGYITYNIGINTQISDQGNKVENSLEKM